MKKDANSNTEISPQSWLRLHAVWLLGFVALLLLGLASWGAWFQKPHINAYRLPPSVLSKDFWAYPVEQNAFRRLPVINSSLNDVFVLPDGKQLWAVGDDGLIVHSADGGFTWQKQTVVTGEQLNQVHVSSINPLGQAWAGEPLNQQLPNSANQSPQNNNQAPAKGPDTVLDNTAQTTEQKSPKDTLPAIEQPATPVTPQRPKEFNANLRTIFFSDASHGWAVGRDGVILATRDGGQHWQAQSSGVNSGLIGVQFSDASHGWAVGEDGVILATRDGGQHWQAQSSGVNSWLMGLQFSDANHGWAVGRDGVILATRDGGQHWQAQPSGVNSGLIGVQFSDASHGWAVGEDGVILATSDGGQHWQAQSSGVNSGLIGVQFSDTNHGWAVGRDGVILATSDGGQHWQAQPSGVNSWLYGLQFSDTNHGWAVGRDGVILATRDGGQHWQAQSSGVNSGLIGVQFSDASHGWAVGEDGVILATRDGGQHWQAQSSGVNSWLMGLQFSDANHGWAVGRDGVILATRDGGQHWQAQPSGVNSGLIGVQFSDASHGWAVGEDGVILATSDGGQHWQAQSSGVNSGLIGVQFSDTNHGWAVGRDGVILATSDGGQHWQAQPSGVNSWLYGLQFSDTNHGWAVGRDGVILATSDGGQHWQAQSSGVNASLNGVQFSDANHGWAVGEDGVILATSDGGQHWQAQPSGVNASLNGVQFSDASHGWAVGEDGVILATSDGGQQWQQPDYRRYPAPWIYLPMSFALLLAATALWQLAGQTNGEKPKKGITDRAITDKPAGPNSKDLLGARKIAAGLTRFLTNKNTQPPITIAITGEWGSGKSSVMNYLFKGLDRQGLTPVWFNAWHHREEQNVLASILTNIHKQAIGPWWTWSGFWFRLRLHWQRNIGIKLLFLIIAFTVTFSSCWLYNNDIARSQLFYYTLYRLGIQQPVMLSQKGYETLCPNAAIVVSKIESTTETTAQPKPKADAQKSAYQSNTKTKTPDIKTEKIDKQEESKLETSNALFNEDNCKKLNNLISEAKQHSDIVACEKNDKDKLCFANHDDLLQAIEQTSGVQLTVENEAALLPAIEHLHPDFPVALSPLLIQLLSPLFAFLAFFTFKGMALIGLAPAKVVQGVLNAAGTTPTANEPVGTRVLFEKHFQRITQVLGKRRLVLFIDDLDRCDREHTRQVLEITNFLASAGELFIVLGMAPRYVLANVTLCFQDVAKAVHEADVLNGDGDSSASPQDAGQSWFARHYLQKLIHIEVPVPKPETAQVLAFLKGETDQAGRDLEDVKMEKLEQAEQRLDDIWEFLGNKLAWVFLLSVIVVGGLWGSGQLSLTSSEQITQLSNADAGVKSQPTETQTPTKQTQASQGREDSKVSGELFKNGANDSNHPVWQILPFITLLLVVVGLFWLSRQPKLLENKWLSWLQPLFHRLKLRLLGPVSGNDSESFADALDIWHELIALTNPTPRNIKAFLNQLRYFASREFSVDTQRDHHEAQLVALASMYYAFGDEMMKTFEFKHSEEKPRLVNLHFKTQIAEKAVLAALETALAKHFAKFGAFPSEQDQKLYQALCEDISIQRHD